jgi:hypothetical protein
MMHHDFSENDFAVIDKKSSFPMAYNEAFTLVGYAASSFEVVAAINMPNDDDNAALKINDATMV